MRRLPALLVLAAALSVLAIACGGSPVASPTPAPVDTPDAAAAAVRAISPLFDGLEQERSDVVGQGPHWTATESGGTWTVTFTIGWGDCQAGCIDSHEWTYRVAPDGSAALQDEGGSPLTEEVIAERRAASTAQGVAGWVVAGPVCPVEQPGDPSCAPRSVAGAKLVVADAAGKEIATVTTDASGLYRVALAPGSYTITPGPVEGYMGVAPPVTFDVLAGAETWVPLAYDTGIR